MAIHMGIDIDAFRVRAKVAWVSELGGWTIDATDGEGCPLLEPDGGCAVHPVKPAQCRAFPFWPEMLDNACVWEESKSFCEGLDAPDGHLFSKEEIEDIRQLMEANDEDQ